MKTRTVSAFLSVPLEALLLALCVGLSLCTPTTATATSGGEGGSDSSPDWFFPAWAARAPNAQPIRVRDTDGALGRYSVRTKEIGLKDLARMHGHLCDGLVIAFVQIKAVLERLFPDGIVDRTDLRAVAKNGPCWVDAVSWMTGARINFQTLRIDNTVGDGFIIQRISTGETYRVALKPGVFPREQAELETRLRTAHAQGTPIGSAEIDAFERQAERFTRKLLTTAPTLLVAVSPLPGYRFLAMDLLGTRGDSVNKNLAR